MRIPLAILFALAASSPSWATPFVPDFSAGPVIFDFEDGLQGWTTDGSAQRVKTQILGGEWAIFGDGLTFTVVEVDEDISIARFDTSLLLEVDLTDVGSITIEHFFAGAPTSPKDFMRLARLELVQGIEVATPIPLTASDSNPGLSVAELSHLVGVHELVLLWGCNLICGFPQPPPDPGKALGFVDNITLIPEPEPGSLLLAVVALWCSKRGYSVRSARRGGSGTVFRKSLVTEPIWSR